MVQTTWVWSLRRKELTAYAEEYGFRLSGRAKTTICSIHQRGNETGALAGGKPEIHEHPISNQFTNSSKLTIIGIVRKLSEKYNGGKDKKQLPRTMPELLRDRAFTWLRINKSRWNDWDLFKRNFRNFSLHSRYFELLKEAIRRSGERNLSMITDDYNRSNHHLLRKNLKTERKL